MTSDATDTPSDGLRERELRALRMLPLALLFVATVLAAATDRPGDGRLAAQLGVSALVAGWLVLGARWETHMPPWRPRSTVFFVGLLGLTAVLVALSPIFGLFAWTGYVFVVTAVPRRGFAPAVVAVAAISAYSQTGGSATDSVGDLAVWLLLIAVNATVAGVVIWFSWTGREQDEHRRRALAELTAAHERLERSAAENAALQAELVERARDAGVQDERGRMAREIHDTLAQGLVAIVTQLEAAEQATGRGGDWRRHHRAAVELAREGLTEARRSVDALRPRPLESARLPDAVADVAREWSGRHDVRVDVATTGDARPLRPELEVTLLRTAQEALANVARHADAHRVGLTLSYMGDVVSLDVRDDGVGFDPVAVAAEPAADGRSGGFGLVAMRERVAGLHGTLEIESEPGGGVALCVTVPAHLTEDPA
ncbi:MAG: sensor histidine kinase [Solirubrobacteraceae bacterium]